MKSLTLPRLISVYFIHFKLIRYHSTQFFLLTCLVASFGLQRITRLTANYLWEIVLPVSKMQSVLRTRVLFHNIQPLGRNKSETSKSGWQGEDLYQLLHSISSWYRNLSQAQLVLKPPSKQLHMPQPGKKYWVRCVEGRNGRSCREKKSREFLLWANNDVIPPIILPKVPSITVADLGKARPFPFQKTSTSKCPRVPSLVCSVTEQQ